MFSHPSVGLVCFQPLASVNMPHWSWLHRLPLGFCFVVLSCVFYSFIFLFPFCLLPIPLCVMCVCTCHDIWQSENNFGCQAILLADPWASFWRFSCLPPIFPLRSAGITDMCYHDLLFRWVLGIWVWVFVLGFFCCEWTPWSRQLF